MGILDLLLQVSSSVSLLGALVVLLLIYVISISFSPKDNRKGPPGPKPLPLFGNFLQVDFKSFDKSLMQLSKKYGSVFTFYLGPKKVVVLAGYKTVKEALVNYAEEFGDRDQPRIMTEFIKGHGLIWTNGELWKAMRRFTLTNLRDFGMGKKACEDKILEECHHLIGVLKKFKEQPFATTRPLGHAFANIISSMVFGNRFEYDDPQFSSLIDSMQRRNQILGSFGMTVYNLFPRLFWWSASRKTFLQLGADSKKQNLQLLSVLKETLNPEKCRGFVDAFLVHKKKLEESRVTDDHFQDDNLLGMVFNLFTGGTETGTNTLRWGLLFLAKYPKIQDQVHEEVSRVVGSRPVQMGDRKNMPFTNAVIHETQRLGNITPLGLPHKTSRDVTFQGYFIKKGTTVYTLLTSVLFDESEWEKPQSFHPAHFLDKDGNFVKRDAFMAFSAGRRACPGESLARMELFLFITTLLQHFRFTPPLGVSEDELDLTPFQHLGLEPLPHKLCAVSRA
ncbi:cytochrome P450 2K1-like isoform X2 [Centropristis striata]|nr:cytochrome P450 2K1-like isoform X2 [Centropristis striata]XP_059211945.1 cytochrome P450 2K1-like isoform X2 [Centropristis striata]XP_059211946.1 cytochrome P450 2K1-like isoform X2 [Centropristis striata]